MKKWTNIELELFWIYSTLVRNGTKPHGEIDTKIDADLRYCEAYLCISNKAIYVEFAPETTFNYSFRELSEIVDFINHGYPFFKYYPTNFSSYKEYAGYIKRFLYPG